MATKRQKRTRKRTLPVQPWQSAWLDGNDRPYSADIEDGEDFFFAFDDELADLWATHGDRIVAEHVAKHPGTRPARWWQRNAPEERLPGESEATFLARHGLLLAGERDRLSDDDFEPESVTVEGD